MPLTTDLVVLIDPEAIAFGTGIEGAVGPPCRDDPGDPATGHPHDLRPFAIPVISLYPGLVRTESVLAAAKNGAFDLSTSESPEFIGCVINALLNDPNLMDLAEPLRVTGVPPST